MVLPPDPGWPISEISGVRQILASQRVWKQENESLTSMDELESRNI